MNSLGSMFGPSKEEIWRQLCTATGADYVRGGFWKGDKVQVTHGQWTITLDTYAVSTGKTVMYFTRLRAPYVSSDRFQFTIRRRGLFSDIAKWLGMQDVVVGHEEFDRDFIIKGTDETKLRSLFDNVRLRELISAQPKIHLTVKDDDGIFRASFPPDVAELHFHVGGIIKEVERLKLLFALFTETLDQLCIIGSATDETPGLKR